MLGVINPQISALLGDLNGGIAALGFPTPDLAAVRQTLGVVAFPGVHPNILSRDVKIPLEGRCLRLRQYLTGKESHQGAIIFMHGGGWTVGSLDSHDELCRLICSSSGMSVLAIEFRLAPEHPFPQPLDDCLDSLRWIATHAQELAIDLKRVALCGDSSGANLAAICALFAGVRYPFHPKALGLFYPPCSAELDFASYQQFGQGRHFLTKSMMKWFWQNYVPKKRGKPPRFAELLGEPMMARLPPTYLLIPEFDPLKDESLLFLHQCLKLGADVDFDICPGLIHGFANLTTHCDAAVYWSGEMALRLAGRLQS